MESVFVLMTASCSLGPQDLSDRLSEAGGLRSPAGPAWRGAEQLRDHPALQRDQGTPARGQEKR